MSLYTCIHAYICVYACTQELDGAKLRISRRRDYEPCPAHLLSIVIPAGLPPPTTALQQTVARMTDGGIQASRAPR